MPSDFYLVFREIEPNRHMHEGDVGFITCYDRKERLEDLPDGAYVIVVGDRTKQDKVPNDWTKRRKKLTGKRKTTLS